MVILAQLPPLPLLQVVALDSIALLGVALPSFYFFLLRPIRDHMELRRGAEEALHALGIPVYGAGTLPPEKAPGVCALSIERHGTGRNLQGRWSVNYFAEFPTSGEQAEQVLARTHRPGQLADEVIAHVWRHTAPFARNLARARERAEFLTRTQGRQRLMYATTVAAGV